MIEKFDTFFPERFVKNRPSINRTIKSFITADFDNYAEDYHKLRDHIRQPVNEWHVGAYLPDELLDERDDILARIRKDDIVLSEKPTKEELDAYTKQMTNKMQTPVWAEWTNWLSKTKQFIKTHPRLEEETETTRSIIEFYKNGRNIFSLSPFLIYLLNHTDIGNIRFSDIKLPYDCIYLHFGSLTDIEYPIRSFEHKHEIDFQLQSENKKLYLDGAFISQSDDHSLSIRLTFIDSKESYSNKVAITKDLRFPTIGFTLSFSKWNEETLEPEINSETTFNDSTVCFYDIWDPKTEPSEIKFHEMHKAIKNPDDCYESEWEEYVLFDKSLMIIINSLCYLNFVDNDIELSTTNERATQIIKELNSTKKHQQVNRLKEKLSKFSYSKIHYCGNRIESDFKVTGTGIEVEPHWRRGHWRNQPFGSGLTNKKLIWIKPTIVRKDKGDPTIGHIYEA